MAFRKSTRSNPSGNCVEVDMEVGATAQTDNDTVAMRDSKNPGGLILEFSHNSWGAFLAGVKASEFDQ